MKKIIWIIIILLVIWGITSLVGDNNEPTSTEPIKIGFVSALTGEASIWGEQLKDGFDFAVKEINENGGINGRAISPIYGDDKCTAKDGVTIFKKMIEVDGVNIMSGSICSSVAMAVAPITQENRVLYMATGATDPNVVKQGDLVFRLWPSDVYEVSQIIEYAINELGIKTLGTAVLSDNPIGESVNEVLNKIANENTVEVVEEESFTSKDRDFRTIITKLISKNPDAIYTGALPGQVSIFINQLKELGYEGNILTYGPSLLSEEVVDQIVDKTNVYYPEPLVKQETNFWSNYKEKNGVDADLATSVGYDSMKIIESGLRECGEDNDCIRDYFLDLEDYPSTRGEVGFDEDGDLTGVEYEIKNVGE